MRRARAGRWSSAWPVALALLSLLHRACVDATTKHSHHLSLRSFTHNHGASSRPAQLELSARPFHTCVTGRALPGVPACPRPAASSARSAAHGFLPRGLGAIALTCVKTCAAAITRGPPAREALPSGHVSRYMSIRSEPTSPGQAAAPAERRRLDIVIVHYDWERLQEMREAWEGFLAQEKVAALQPSVFIYCHNYDEAKAEQLDPLFSFGGGVVPVENAGREGSGYLEHILRHWHELADHTLFSQDAPWPMLQNRFLRMFREDTGFLPLAVYGDVKCDFADIVPTGLVQQIYSMLTHRLCPPEGWAAGFNGEFVVSRHRILANRKEIYAYLLDMLAAPSKHWLHETHDMPELKDRSNPMFGHVVERAWSLAFNCYEPSHFDGCWECNDNDCDRDNCQCFDSPEGQ